MKYQIIEDYSYSAEDINDIVIKNENYDYFKNICHILMVGSTIISTSEVNAENNNIKNKSNPIIEVIADTTFKIEDYEQNVFSLEDYKFYNSELVSKDLTERILSFKSLQESWDGFGAIPLEIRSATNAINFINFLSQSNTLINPTDVFPNPHGTISMIWENLHKERLSLEIFNNVELKENNIENIARKINSLF